MNIRKLFAPTRNKAIAVMVMILLVLPLFIEDPYIMNIIILSLLFAVLACSWNLICGYTGIFTFGHQAFFGLGAYLSGILTATHGWNPWLAMLAAAVAVGLLAFAIGFPILKLKGHYLAMATLGFGIIVYIVFNEYVDVTGGPSGLPGIPNLAAFGITFDNDLKNFYLIWGIALATILLTTNLVHSRIGRALRAIHDSEVAAQVLGVNARLLKVQIFACSAVISCVAGSLYAHSVTFISPASFGFHFSVELLTMVIIGGLGSIYGSFLGAALLTLLPELLHAPLRQIEHVHLLQAPEFQVLDPVGLQSIEFLPQPRRDLVRKRA